MATGMNVTRKIYTCATCGLIAVFAGCRLALAADFSQAQKIYVPATSIPRNSNYLRVRTPDSAGLNRYVGDSGPASGNPYAPSSAPSSSGLVPPPPPTAPLLSGNSIVPPPPAASSSGTAASGKASHGKTTAKQTKPSGGISSPTAAARAKAQELIKAGKLDEAESLLKDTYRSWPKDSLVSNDLVNLDIDRAKKFLAANDYDNALKATREAVYVNPSSVTASNLLDQIHKQRGVDPNNAGERVQIADLLAAQGRTTAATVEYRAALKIKPYAPAHVGLGNLAVRNGNKTLAKQEYQIALEIDPNSALAHRQMGILRLNNGDKVGASSDLSRAVILDPNDKIAGKQLIELWQRQVAVAPGEASGHMGLARAYQLTGDLSAAQAEYRTVVKLDPDNPNLPAARQSFKLALARQQAARSAQAAHTLESQGAIQEANQKITEALGYCPTDPNYRIYQGQLLERLGQVDSARQSYLGVLRDDPNNVIAAQRLKALSLYGQQGPSSYMAAPQQPQPVGLKATMAPPLVPPSSAPAAAAGNVAAASGPATAGLAAFAGGTALGIPLTEAPPLPTLPTPNANDPVTNLSNFLVSLRDHSLSQKQQIQNYESAAHSALNNSIQQKIGSALGLGSLSPSSAAPATGTAAAGALGAITGTAAAGTAAAGAASSSVTPAQALASAAAALGLPTGNILGGNSSSTSATPANTAIAAAAPATSAAPAASAADLQAAVQRLNALEQQNQALAAQLQQAQQKLQDLQSVPPAAYPSPPVGGYANPAGYQPIYAAPPAVQATTPPSQTDLPAPSPEPQLKPPLPSPSSMLAPEQNISPVSFELTGFSPSKSSVQLKVVLKNAQDSSFKLPSGLKAIVKTAGKPDITVKPSFHGAAIPPHGELEGVVSVPAKQLDPASDLVIPDLLPADSGQRDVHLITRVSSL